MSRSLAVLLLALGCVIAASASRSPMDVLEMPWSSLTQSSRSDDKDRAMVVFKHFVPPGMKDDFLNKWDSYIGKQASKAKGNIKINLMLPVISNAIHYDYSEWETMDDFACFFKSKDSKDFMAYLADQDIKYEIEFLMASPGQYKETAVDSRKSHIFPVLTTVIVKPHHAESFIDAFMTAEEKTSEENGNQVYHLHRVLTTNDKFYLYGAWTSEEAWKDHRDSNHIRKLAEWADKHDVVFVESPLMRMSVF